MILRQTVVLRAAWLAILGVCNTGLAAFEAEYFANTELRGTPVFSRKEDAVDHYWYDGGPGNGVPSDFFSARWYGRFEFEAGTHVFRLIADDGARVWVDQKLVLDCWVYHGLDAVEGAVDIDAGEHEVRVEYREMDGWAVADVSWQRIAKATVDKDELVIPENKFVAEYFANVDLSGSPAIVRNESVISHWWFDQPPVEGVGSDSHSTRWQGWFQLEEGTYRFTSAADDGIRIRVDDQLVTDEWAFHGWDAVEGQIELEEGRHLVCVEHCEQYGWSFVDVVWERLPDPLVPYPQGKFLAEYYDNTDVQGRVTLMRYEDKIDHNWQLAAPGPNVPLEHFSGRWTGRFDFEQGDHVFFVQADDGVRVWLDEDLIVDQWQEQARGFQTNVPVTAGEHNLRVEYCDVGGLAEISVDWSRRGENGVRARYYNGLHFDELIAEEVAGVVDWRWGASEPATGVPADMFSTVMQSYLVVPASGTYRLSTLSDDSALVFLAGERVINTWCTYRLDPILSESEPLTLAAGTRYAIEVLHNDTGLAASLQLLIAVDGEESVPVPMEWLVYPDDRFPATDLERLNFAEFDSDGDLVVYTDAFGQNWHDWSWGCTVDAAYTEKKHSGAAAIRVDMTPGGSFSPFFSNDQNWWEAGYRGVSTREFSSLGFWVQRGTFEGGEEIIVRANDVLPGSEWRNSAVFALPTDDSWHHVTIPLADIDAADSHLSRLALIAPASTAGTILLDDIIFSKARTPVIVSRDSVEAAADTSWLYRDERNSRLGNSSNVDLTLQHPVAGSGSFSLRVGFYWYGTVEFRDFAYQWGDPQPLQPAGADTLAFLVNQEGDDWHGDNLNVYAKNADDVVYGNVALSEFIQGGELDTDPETWQEVVVRLGDLGLAGQPYAVGIQEGTGVRGLSGALLLDDVRMVRTGPAHEPDPSEEEADEETPADVTAGPALTINAAAGHGSISPLIYGINGGEANLAAELGQTVRRRGGNAMSRYNWRTDASNVGADWYFENMVIHNDSPDDLPRGSEADHFVASNWVEGIESIITVPMLGWVAKDREPAWGFSVKRYGAQREVDAWQSDAGNGILPDGKFVTGNNPADTSVRSDPQFASDWVEHLAREHGRANFGGVQFYSLDNEPMLWSHTHRDVHPRPAGYDELWERSRDYAVAVKSTDSGARTLGPALWGWTAYFYSALDRESGSNWVMDRLDRKAHGDTPLVEWYLQQMKQYEETEGVRLLDYLDLHFYPQASGVALSNTVDTTTQELRLRSTRALWDPAYVDESWISEPVMLIPRMRAWVQQHYPGTKIAISEYNWGGMKHLNGALAQADILGIFGREGVDLATMWDPPGASDPGAFAFRMYRNYDGQGGRFGETRVQAGSADQAKLSIYASLRQADGALVAVVVNKAQVDLSSTLSIANFASAGSASVFRYGPTDLRSIHSIGDVPVMDDGLLLTFPCQSITVLAIQPAPADSTPETP